MTGPDGASTITRMWLSTIEAAQYTGRSRTEVYLALQTGELVGYQKGKRGKWRIHANDLDSWMRGNQADVA